MRSCVQLGLAGSLATVLLFAGAPARAQNAPNVPAPVIVIVDVQQILHDSLAAKNVQEQMNLRTENYTKEVSEQEATLQRTQNDIERQRSVLPADAFNVKMRDFQQHYDALDHGVQVTRQTLQQAYNDAMTKVENSALQIIADIAAERKANLVVTKAAVLFDAQGLDITPEVLARLDAKLPDVTLNLPPDSGLALPPAPPAAPQPAAH